MNVAPGPWQPLLLLFLSPTVCAAAPFGNACSYYMVFVFTDRSEKESYALAEKWLVEQGKDHLKRLTVPKEYLASFVSRRACCICDVLH